MMKTVYDLIDILRPDPHAIMADGAALFLAAMSEAKDIDIEDQRMYEFNKKRHLPWKRPGGPVPDRRPNVTSFRK